LSDSWGYVFDAYCAVWMVDGTAAYRDASFRPLGALWDTYRGYDWEPSGNVPGNPKGSQDGYADAIESALNLFNRLPPGDPRAASTAVAARELSGEELRRGLPVQLEAGRPLRLTVQPLPIETRSGAAR
jgi:hypothetical protein